MSMTQAELLLAFDAEAGDVASLATTAQKTLWFNQGQSRMLQFYRAEDDFTWLAGSRDEDLPADFVRIEKLIYDDVDYAEAWKVRGNRLIIDDFDGATKAGSARLYYEAHWPLMTGAIASSGSRVHDEACLCYALSRFYKMLSSSRSDYRRYATLVGANAVGIEDLQAESDRWYNDFLDAREDVQLPPPVGFTED